MTVARIRSALAPALKILGFSRRGSEFVLRQPRLEHAVCVSAVRRLGGYFEIVHSVSEVEDVSPGIRRHPPLIQDRVQGFTAPYLGLWALDSFDSQLAARQVAAIASAFSSLADVAHFYSDRPLAHGVSALPLPAAAVSPNSLSKAQAERSLRHHSAAVFAGHFTPVPRLGQEIWAHCQEVGGYRYCAYLAATSTATFATLLYFPFASTDIEKGSKNDNVLRLLIGAPKHLLSDEGQPVLVPLAEDAFDHQRVSAALVRQRRKTAPHALVRVG